MKKLSTTLLLIASAFMLSSCGDSKGGDSKDKVFDDYMDLMEEAYASMEKGDESDSKLKEFETRENEIDKRAKAVGLDFEDILDDDSDSFTDAQRKRFGETMGRMMKAQMKANGFE